MVKLGLGRVPWFPECPTRCRGWSMKLSSSSDEEEPSENI